MTKHGMLAVLLASLACSQESPTGREQPERALALAAAEVAAEEEILGGVFVNGGVPATSTMWIRLVPLGDGADLLDANGNSSPSDGMPIKLQGSRHPAKTTPDGQWGWYDPEAGDGPCRANALDKSEVHDINPINNVPDGNEGGGIEKHCAKRGAYRVELLTGRFGSVVQSREIDKVRVQGNIGQKGIENPNLTSGGPTNVADVWIHFDTGTASYTVSGTYRVDNATTTGTYGDTVGTTADNFRFDAQHTTNWPGTTRGELSVRYDWGDGQGSRFSSTDEVIRVKKYGFPGTYSAQADVIHPRGTGLTDQLHKVIVQAPVASVDVSPSSATITTQNGTTTLTATLRDAAGNVLTGRTITWTSSNTAVATVSGSGGSATVTGKANGTATITATSEGKSDTSTITVNFPTGDNAAAAGHTLPSSFYNGSHVSVTVSMKNTGTTTWNSTSYSLFQSQGLEYWTPGQDAVTGSVSPNQTHAFAFTLGMDDPSRRGTTACFFRMYRSGSYFGAENGRNIEVTGPKGGGTLAAMSMTGVGPAALGFDPAAAWLTNAIDGGTSRLPLDQAAFRANEIVAFEYSYAHEEARTVDVVFRYSYDQAVFEPLPLQITLPGITVESGIGQPGDLWVRVSGVVPQGNGTIIDVPFTLRPGAKAPRNSAATVTLYYPN